MKNLNLIYRALALGLDIENPWNLPTDIWTLFDRVIDYLQILAVPIAVALFLWAAFLYLTSAGNEKKVSQANATLLWTVVGLGLIFMARGLISIIKDVFTGSI